MALALAGCAGGDNNLAGWRHANGRPFEWPESGVFDAACDTQPAQLAAPFGFVAPCFEMHRVDFVENEVQRADIIAAIIGDRRTVACFHSSGVGHLVGSHEAAAPNLLPIHTKVARDTVGKALEQECDVRPASPTYRRRWHQVREDDID